MDQHPIAQRFFTVSGQSLTCRIFAPQPEDVGFRCHFEILCQSTRQHGSAMGEDSVQALLNALAKARFMLEDWDSKVTWLGGDRLGLPGLEEVLNVFTPSGAGLGPRGSSQSALEDESALGSNTSLPPF